MKKRIAVFFISIIIITVLFITFNGGTENPFSFESENHVLDNNSPKPTGNHGLNSDILVIYTPNPAFAGVMHSFIDTFNPDPEPETSTDPESEGELTSKPEHTEAVKQTLTLPQAITLSPISAKLAIGSEFDIKYSIEPTGAVPDVTVSCSDESVASVNGKRVKIVGSGTAKITVTTANGLSASCTLTVGSFSSITSIAFPYSELQLNVGESKIVLPLILPENAAEKNIKFSIPDSSIISIGSDGAITALKIGRTTITATTDNGLSSQMTVLVTTDVKRIEITLSNDTVAVGDTVTAKVDIFPEGLSDRSYTLSADSEDVVISGNHITCGKAGTFTITASSPGAADVTAVLHVVDPESLKDEVIRLTNAERLKLGLQTLEKASSGVVSATSARAQEITQKYSHIRPNGTKWHTITEEYGITDRIVGENLACGQKTAAEVVSAWMKSSSHRENMVNPDFTHLAVGLRIVDGVFYWSQMFVGN